MLGTDTSSAPSGVHAASLARGTRAHTDIVQPAGTIACRGSSNGASARSSGTSTVTGSRPAGASAVGAGDAGEVGAGPGAGLVEHPASRRTPTRPIPIRLCGSQTRMHLPDENLRGFGGGDALSTRRGEPHGVALVQRPGTFQGDLAARHEQVQIWRLR